MDPLAQLAESRRREGYGPLALAFAIAVAVHVLSIPLFVAMFGQRDVRSFKDKGGAQLVRLSAEAWEQNRRIQLEVKGAEADEVDRKTKPKKDDEELEAPGQIVTLPRPKKEQRPDFADYASEWDQTVERETRSRDQRQRAPAVADRLVDGIPANGSVARREGVSSSA